MEKVIKNYCDVKDFATYSEIVPFQGNLKDLVEVNFNKLKKEIITEGFASPVFVWLDRSTGVKFILDGHQRQRVVKYLVENEGYDNFPIPIVYIMDESFDKAKRRLLSYVSTYGTLNTDGLREYMFDARIEMEELESRFRFASNEFDLDKFKAEHFKDLSAEHGTLDTGKSLSEYNATYDPMNIKQIMLIFDDNEYMEAVETFNKVKEDNKLETNTQAALLLLREYANKDR